MDDGDPPRAVTRLGLWLSDLSRAPRNGGILELATSIAHSAEEVGFDSLWVSDRIRDVAVGRSPNAPPTRPGYAGNYEVYSLLGALATRTDRIRLGAWPIGSDARAPAVLTKIVTAVDVISHGRGVVALAPDPDDGLAGVERLEEQLQVCRSVLEDEHPEFAGRHYRIDGAVNRPRPVQPGGIPLVVSLDRGKPVPSAARTEGLRVAARLADAVVVGGDPVAVEAAVGTVRAVAVGNRRGHGSHPSTRVKVVWAGSVLVDDEARAAPVDALSGPPTQVAEDLRNRLGAGAEGCIVSLAGYDQIEAVGVYGPVLLDAVRSVVGGPEPG